VTKPYKQDFFNFDTSKNTNYSQDDDVIYLIDLIDNNNYINSIDNILNKYQFIKENENYAKISTRKQHGIYYTNFKLAYKITNEAMYNIPDNIVNFKFFEPCAGLGIFVITYLEYIHKHYSLSNEDLEKIFSNIYISDIDGSAINLAKLLIGKYIKIKFNMNYIIQDSNIYIGNVLHSDNNIHTAKSLFNVNFKFDVILTNPPYKNLKASSKELTEMEYKEYQNYCKLTSKLIKKELYLQQGTINLYKVFIELIFERFTTNIANIGLIIPSSLLSDYTSTLLRKHIVNNSNIKNIYMLSESTTEFNSISQAMCYFGAKKNNTTNLINIIDDNKLNTSYKISLKNMNDIDSNYSLVKLTDNANYILNSIHKFQKIKDIDDIYNLRGELDLTLDKKYITENKTVYPLLQGRHIREWGIKTDTKYVEQTFTTDKPTSKKDFINNDRIICQQISNMSTNKRLKFAKITKNYVLGNSCNFITVNKNINLDYLLAILNSYLMDWRFQLFSSNNHINNYELNDLPINIDNKYINLIIKYSIEIQNGNLDRIIDINKVIFTIYNLDDNHILEILNHYNDKYATILKESIINNVK